MPSTFDALRSIVYFKLCSICLRVWYVFASSSALEIEPEGEREGIECFEKMLTVAIPFVT